MGCSQTKCRLCVIFFSSSLHHFRRHRHPLLLSCTLSFRGLVYSSVLAPTLKLEKTVDRSVSSCRLASFDIQRSGDIDANTNYRIFVLYKEAVCPERWTCRLQHWVDGMSGLQG